jgi:alpha-1,3-mannosyltransferase
VRVVHVVRQFHPGVGGIESFVLALAKQQRLQGLDAQVVTLDRLFTRPAVRLPAHDSVEGVPVRRIEFSVSSRYPIAPGVRSCIETFDIVHVHGVDFFCDYLALVRWRHRKCLVLSTHGGFFHTAFASALKTLFFHTVTRWSLRRYARVFACSVNDEALFRKVTGRQLVRIDNGVDTAKFADHAARTFTPTLVYFGRFASNKGLERLIAAFDVLCDRRPDARLHLMGRDWDGLLPALQGCIRAARHGSRISMHVDPSDADIRSVIAESSFFVSASRYEGFGLALVEALAAGLVPIVARIPSFANILGETGKFGHLVDFDDAELAGTQMADFIAETGTRYGALRLAAMALADAYAWQQVAPRFVREYERVLGWREREILGVKIRPMNREQAIAHIDRGLDAGQPLNVSFANAHTLNVASTNERFRDALQNFLVLNDGVGVDIASRVKFGRPFVANLNGTDFVPDYLELARHRLRIYLVGTTDAIVAKAAQELQLLYPRHTIVGWRNGFFSGADEVESTCRNIRTAGADCVLVGMGNPLQELWIAEHGDKTGARLLFGVGALLDFRAGQVQRAPTWVRNLRCEWIYRLLQEPRRLARRYLVDNFVFLARVLADVRQTGRG